MVKVINVKPGKNYKLEAEKDISDPARIAEIYNRKKGYYSEGTIYSALRMEDFNQDLFPKIRNLIRSKTPNHPWLSLSDEQMLVKAGLFKRDSQTSEEGYTLAAALLLGKEETIQSILPYYKVDALVRIQDQDRYDDRLYIQTNLIEAYEQLMGFIAKHLKDPFFLEGDSRISLRDKIFREVVANILVHREYTDAHPTTLIIYDDRVEARNANVPHGAGPILLDSFIPFSKNPTLAKFFIQLAWVEELGSGIINVNKYLKLYTNGAEPQFIEGNPFQTIIPLINPSKEKKEKESNKSSILSQKPKNSLFKLLKRFMPASVDPRIS